MYAITLWQPWASLIAAGIKVQETRNWAPPHWLIGQRIAIHAAKRRPTKALLKDLPQVIHDDMCMYARYGHDWVDNIPYGAVVCTAKFFGVAQIVGTKEPGKESLAAVRVGTGEHIRIFPDPYGDYSVGRYIWGLQHIQKKRHPVPMAGKQGLWKCKEILYNT